VLRIRRFGLDRVLEALRRFGLDLRGDDLDVRHLILAH